MTKKCARDWYREVSKGLNLHRIWYYMDFKLKTSRFTNECYHLKTPKFKSVKKKNVNHIDSHSRFFDMKLMLI
ncbi:hypothetical protein MH1LPH_04480 [Lactiplantibacillus brownii]